MTCRSSVLLGFTFVALIIGSGLLREDGVAQRDPGDPSGVGMESTVVVGVADQLGVLEIFRERIERMDCADGVGERESFVELARRRHGLMLELIRNDPEEALRHSVSFSQYHRLPDSIRDWVEEPFSSAVEIDVLPICNAPDGIHRELVEIGFGSGGIRWKAQRWGSRASMQSRSVALVQGIRLGGRIALDDGVATPVAAVDRDWVEQAFAPGQPDLGRSFLTGTVVGDDPVVALLGGKRIVLADGTELAELNRRAAWLDALPGPDGGSGLLHAMPFPADGASGIDWTGIESTAINLASSWTETPKDVFLIRVDFSDHTAADHPLPSAATLEQVFDLDADSNLAAMSYGKAGINATVGSGITRMPNPTTTYTALVDGSSQNRLLHDEAKSAYLAANPGWNESDYDIVAVFFDGIGMRGSSFTYAGLAGGPRLWLQGTASASVVTHELGHNYGLGHSSLWVPPAGSLDPVDPGGANDEYGDPFDVMGSGDLPDGHFNAQAKVFLNWLGAGDWADATALGGGLFRIYRLDDPGAAGLRGVRVTKGADEFYWIAHRRSFSNESLDYGAYLQWERTGSERSWLIDTTPDSITGSDDRLDAGLALGATYSDPVADVHITALGRGGEAPQEWLEVEVGIGPFPGNQSPVATLSAPATASARRTVMLSVAASDPDGDPLAYDWVIDGVRQGENHPSIPYVWQGAGTSTVAVTVSDRKGGKTTLSQAVQVTDSLETWQVRATGRSVNWRGAATDGTRVVLVGRSGGAWAWSLDGVNWNSGQMGLNHQMEDMIFDGSQFVAVGMDYDFGIKDWVGLIRTATDGETWVDRYRGGGELKAVAYGNGIRLAGGDDGSLVRSTDGLSWSPVTSPISVGSRIAGLAYGDGVFVLTAHAHNTGDGFNGGHEVWTSPDGLIWTDRTAGTVLDSWRDLRGVAWIGGRFVASGWYSGVLASTDGGANFESVIAEPVEFFGLTEGSGIWLGAGVNRSTSAPTIQVSSDGVNWQELAVAAPSGMKTAVAFGDTFVIAGDGDLIWQSAAVEPAAAGYPVWRRLYYPDRDASSRFGSDGDGDLLLSLVEYGLGTSPVDGSAPQGVSLSPMPVTDAVDALLAGRLVLSFSLPEPAPADARYTVEVSPNDLGSWTALARKEGTGDWAWLVEGPTRIVSTPAGDRVAVAVADRELLANVGASFMRLRVEIRSNP